MGLKAAKIGFQDFGLIENILKVCRSCEKNLPPLLLMESRNPAITWEGAKKNSGKVMGIFTISAGERRISAINSMTKVTRVLLDPLHQAGSEHIW